MSRSYEERLSVVLQAKSGKPIRELSREYGLHENKITEWVRKYDKYGAESLQKQPNIKATGSFKEQLVRLFLEKGVSLAQIVVDYRVSRTAIETWVRDTRKYGYRILHEKKIRGRPPKTPMGRPKKKEPQTELEKLQAENLRLRAENALLKKVKALVEEQEARARLNGQKPSTN
mgnify:CR=1 FL=1